MHTHFCTLKESNFECMMCHDVAIETSRSTIAYIPE